MNLYWNWQTVSAGPIDRCRIGSELADNFSLNMPASRVDLLLHQCVEEHKLATIGCHVKDEHGWVQIPLEATSRF